MANRFILVANLIAQDGGTAIIAGNERVVRARLSDAKFFWDQDRSRRLDDYLPELEGIIFHDKLGTQAERVERLKALAGELAKVVGADPDKAERAAELCKADLVTDMVVEFPDLQGLMGRYYALDQGEDPSVAAAIEEHYRPQGPNDAVPTDPVSIAVALADKLDTLVGFWAIDEKPTGSKDPYALRRAALGTIRIVLEGRLRLNLMELVKVAVLSIRFERLMKVLGELEYLAYVSFCQGTLVLGGMQVLSRRIAETIQSSPENRELQHLINNPSLRIEVVRLIPQEGPNYEEYYVEDAETHLSVAPIEIEDNLLSFFHDRLKVYLRDRGARHDLIDAVISPEADDFLMIVARVESLSKFLETDDGANLLIGVKRASNILRIEEKKDKHSFDGLPDSELLQQDEEKALASAIFEAAKAAGAAIEKEDFQSAMAEIAKLRTPVDAFFDNVTVNTDDPKLRENRLKLLNQIREATRAVADFSKIEG